jgi:serine/threonine protein kinase
MSTSLPTQENPFVQKIQRYNWVDFDFDKDERPLGEGSCAIVLKAKWKKLNRTIAIKVVTESMTKAKGNNFTLIKDVVLKEGDVILQAKHKGISNIIDIYGLIESPLPREATREMNCSACTNDQAIGLVMEYCENGSLSTLLHPSDSSSPRIPLTMKATLTALAQIATTLFEMHSFGVIHGDIKPQNVLIFSYLQALALQPVFQTKLIDFGLSSIKQNVLTHNMKSMSMVNHTTGLKGTAPYCAPEMLNVMKTPKEANATASRVTDSYAFGILAWEALARRVPFEDDSNFPHCIFDGTRPPLELLPPDTPTNVINMITSCWDGDRKKRKPLGECLSILNHELTILGSGEYDLFFSHPWVNKPFLSHVHRLLVEAGFRVWYDKIDMGANLIDSMSKGIQNSRVFLVCLSEDYINSKNCSFELGEAKKCNKPILAVLLDKSVLDPKNQNVMDLCSLNTKKYVDMTEIATKLDWHENTNNAIDEELWKMLSEKMQELFLLLQELNCCVSEESKVISFFLSVVCGFTFTQTG